MYPWEQIDPDNDTTLSLIHECVKREHGVAITTPANLTIRDSETFAFCRAINKMEKVPGNLKSFHKKVTLREEMLPLAGFDVIILRSNPPLDMIMLNFLDSVKDDVFIMNDVDEFVVPIISYIQQHLAMHIVTSFLTRTFQKTRTI